MSFRIDLSGGLSGLIIGLGSIENILRRNRFDTQNLVKCSERRCSKVSYSECPRLRTLGVSFVTGARAIEITGDCVYVVVRKRTKEHVQAGTVTLALGSEPKSELLRPLRKRVNEVYAVDDCVEPRDILETIREVSEVGRIV